MLMLGDFMGVGGSGNWLQEFICMKAGLFTKYLPGKLPVFMFSLLVIDFSKLGISILKVITEN